MKLSDATGKLIMQQKVNAAMQRIELPALQKGLYVVTVISEEEMKIHYRLIIL